MATRNTEQEAKELMNNLTEQFPGRRFEIRDTSSECVIGRVIAESKGWTIIEDTGGCMVTVFQPVFEVSEVRICRDCRNNYTTIAIGEADLGLCASCDSRRKERQEQELAQSIKMSQQRINELDWRNAWEER